MSELLIALLNSGDGKHSRTGYAVLLRVAGLIAAFAGVILGALYFGGPAWSVGAALVMVLVVGLLLQRVQPLPEEPPREKDVRPLTPEELRVRAAHERAERELIGRGTHPLGHPGSGGYVPPDE